MARTLVLAIVAVGAILFISRVRGHGRIMNPPSRSSLWRLEEFAMYDPPVNFDDNQLWCGGLNAYIANGLKCGVCGDPYNDTAPRENEDGGKYDMGLITRYYKSGEIVIVDVELTQSHLGYWTLKLCPEEALTEECFDKYVLTFPRESNSDKFYVKSLEPNQMHSVAVQLPKGLQCSRCVMQWEYKTGNTWGMCENGTYGTGCGPQETFRNCADVTIL